MSRISHSAGQSDPDWVTPPRKRFDLAALVFPMSSAIAFGVGIVAILLSPSLLANAFVTIPPMIWLASLVSGAVMAWALAPRLRARYRDELS